MILKSLTFIAGMLLFAGGAGAQELKLAVTTSFANSGLAEILLPKIEADTGITVQLLVVGTGQALALGAAGDVDAVLVHSRAAEETWLAEGNGTHRREIMYNDFVIVGPESDPVAAGKAVHAAAVFTAIATASAPFVSRGDDSGTHKAELALWQQAGIDPDGEWYRAIGQGMGAALNTAAGMGAYILADRASWLNFGNKSDLVIVFQGDPALFNQYAFLPVNPAKHPHVKAQLVQVLENWLVGDTAKGLIEGYKIADQQLFVFNAIQN